MMTGEQLPDKPEAESREAQIGRRQVAAADLWSTLYPRRLSDNAKLSQSSEIIFCAPLAYSREVNLTELPESLQSSWRNLMTVADSVATSAANEPMAWTTEENGLEKIHSIVASDAVSPEMRGLVSEVGRLAAMVFDHSIEHAPYDLDHYERYVMDAEAWLERARRLD